MSRGLVPFWICDDYCTMLFGHPNTVDFWTMFEHGWEDDTFAVLDKFLNPSVTFLDIGAWKGPMSLYASRLCRSVLAVEPDPAAYAYLQAHILENRLTNITPMNVAISPGGGPITMGRKQAGEFGDSMTSIYYSHETIRVDSVSLRELVPPDCGLIKMDIEGYEADVLDGFELTCPLWVSTHDLHPTPEVYAEKLDRFLSRYPHEKHDDNYLVMP